MTHHVITIFLISTSYFSNFTRVGCLVLVLMDWCDIFLPVCPFSSLFCMFYAYSPQVGKNASLHRLHSTRDRYHLWLVPGFLVCHAACPVQLRHCLHLEGLSQNDPFCILARGGPVFDQDRLVDLLHAVDIIAGSFFFTFHWLRLTVDEQILHIIWFGMICRVAWRVLTTDKGASDDRSDERSV